MTLRLALVEPADAGGTLASLAASLPADWVVLSGLGADDVIEQAAIGGLDAVFVAATADEPRGVELLAQVQRAHPEALRVLVLPADVEPRLRERLAAHPAVQQVLAAPFAAGDVRAAMRRLLTVRSLLRDASLRAALGDVDRLPASPSAYLSLRMLIADDDAGLTDALAVLQRDPVLAARVLRTANSALFSRGRPIHDLAGATQRLGLQTIAQLVLASEVFSRLSSSAASDAEARALHASTLAMRIARTPRDAGLAGSAALLAELGTLLPGSLLNAPPQPGEVGRAAPRAALLGAALMALWGLPMEMVEAVAFHHRPSMMKGRGLDVVGGVHLARALVGAVPLDEAYVDDAGLRERLDAWRALAGLTPAA